MMEMHVFSVTRGTGSYNSQGGCNGGHGISRLKSQLSFKRQDSLSQISEVSENIVDGISSDNGHRNATHSYATASFPMDAWDNSNTIVFSTTPSKRANINGDLLNSLSSLESQVLKFSIYVQKDPYGPSIQNFVKGKNMK